jgi:hypothetical protein
MSSENSTDRASHLAKDAARKSAGRAEDRDLRIPRVIDPIRRRDCLANTYEFLKVYFGSIFYQEFTSGRREMIDAIEHAATYGGDQAIAGPRADGKSRSALFVTLKLELANKLRFPLIISKSGGRASRELKNLKDAFRDNPLLLADFPEVFYPIKKMGRWASRAAQQTAYGQYTNMEWGDEVIIFPTLPTELLRANGWNKDIESAATGQITASLGIEGPIRGYSIRNERPDLAIIDDIDDRESARSELQTETRERIIEEDIGGLAGPDKTIARVMLCTLINRMCIAARFTDRKKKPSWKGQRHKLMSSPPERMDLWEEYIGLRSGREPDDPDARKAHAFYLLNRDAMDSGAVVTNEQRYDGRPLSNGEPGQVSALQACFDIISDRNWEHFNTEYQNDPPAEEDENARLVLTSYRIEHGSLSGHDRRMVPADTVAVTIGADVGKKLLHWVAIAWDARGVGAIIDYDAFVFQTEGRKAADCEVQILEGLFEWHAGILAAPFTGPVTHDYPDGVPILPSRVLVDTGWKEESWNIQPVKRFCKELSGRYEVFIPSKGIANYRQPKNSHTGNIGAVGDNWHIGYVEGVPIVEMNTDHWKLKVHEGFLAERGQPGAIGLWAHPRVNGRVNRMRHKGYAAHILSEFWGTKFVQGSRGPRTGWWVESTTNHWLDATYQAIVGRSVLGIDVLGPIKQHTRKRSPVVVSTSQSNQSRW